MLWTVICVQVSFDILHFNTVFILLLKSNYYFFKSKANISRISSEKKNVFQMIFLNENVKFHLFYSVNL